MNRMAGGIHALAVLVFVVAVPAGSLSFAAAAALLTALALVSESEPDAPWRSRDARGPAIIVVVGLLAAWLLPSPGDVCARNALAVYGLICGAGWLARRLGRAGLELGGRRVASRRATLDGERRGAVARMNAATRREDDLRRVLARMDRVRDVVRTIGFAMRVPDILAALGRVARDVLSASASSLRLRQRPDEIAEYVLGRDLASPVAGPSVAGAFAFAGAGGGSGSSASGNMSASHSGTDDALTSALPSRYLEEDWAAARQGRTERRGESWFLGRPLGGRHGDALILEVPAATGDTSGSTDDTIVSESADLMASIAGLSLEKAFLLAEIEARSRTDALTTLTNRRRFDMLYREEWARAERQNAPCTILMMDVDRFKSFNDTYGHAVGDLVLKAVAGTLAGLGRRLDVIARYGGEEFVAFLPETDLAGALKMAERIRIAVAAQRIPVPGQPLPLAVTLSIGVAARSHNATPEALLEAADAALYRAKTGGRNRVES